jgi:cytochrome c5
MQTYIAKKQLLLTGLILGACAAFVAAPGCHQTPVAQAPASTRPATAAADSGPSGAQLWAQTCSRCHNMRSPDYFSDAEWHVVCQHMRFRANLTGEEQRKIVAFLKASN